MAYCGIGCALALVGLLAYRQVQINAFNEPDLLERLRAVYRVQR